MAVLELNPAFSKFSGKLGNMVFYNSFNTLCARVRVVPRNPDTYAQKVVRRTFGDAVRQWQNLDADTKALYNKRGRKKGLRGYSLFISEYMRRSIAVIKQRCSADTGLYFRSLSAAAPLQLRSGTVAASADVHYGPGGHIFMKNASYT